MDRYGRDVLGADPHARRRRDVLEQAAERGLVVEDAESGWTGAVVSVEKSGGMHVVSLEDRKGRRRSFRLGDGFLIDGAPVRLLPPSAPSRTTGPTTAGGRKLTASGSIAVEQRHARVARASRIWVEGAHDAELVERVWGDDLRVEGVVVEMLSGVDNLEAYLRDFAPSPGRRAGVLVDHLVPGSKESRIVRECLGALGPRAAAHVLVLGHPYVDVWQAIRPHRVGLDAWPRVPRGIDIKTGTLAALGWPHADAGDVARGWKRLLGVVRDYRDLEPALLGRMEELIDFVTAGGD